MALPPLPPQESRLLANRPAYLVLGLVFLLHVSVGAFLQQTNLPFGIAYGELLFFAGIPWLAVLAMGFAPAAFFNFHAPAARAWPWVVVAAFAGFALAGGFNSLNRHLVGPELADQFDSTKIFLGLGLPERIALTIGVAVFAPLGEELLFRGYLMRILWARYGGMGALLVTSGLFALAHFNPASIFALFILGLVFGLLRQLSGSILPSLAAHAMQNGTTAFVVLAGLAEETPEELEFVPTLLLIACSLPFLLLALRMVLRTRTPDSEILEVPDPLASRSRVRLPLLLWMVVAVASILLLFALQPG